MSIGLSKALSPHYRKDTNFSSFSQVTTSDLITRGEESAIVSISSVRSQKSFISCANNTSKSTVNSLTRNVTSELGPKGIRTNSLLLSHGQRVHSKSILHLETWLNNKVKTLSTVLCNSQDALIRITSSVPWLQRNCHRMSSSKTKLPETDRAPLGT